MADLSADLASLRIQREEDPNRPKRGRTVVAYALVLAAVVGAGIYGYSALEPRIFKTEVAITEITSVSPAQASVTVTSTGYVVPQIISKVGAKIAGRVAKVLVKEGSEVKAGDVLVELESSDQKSSIAAAGSRAMAAAARVETARANLADLQQQVAREQALVDKGAVGRAVLEDLLAKAKSAEQAMKAAEAEARASHAEMAPLQVNLKDLTIASPIDGTIISKPVAVGELVGPQNNIAEVADFKSQLVETDVPEGRLYLIKPSSPCEIALDAYPGRRYRGSAVEIGTRVDRAKATVKVKVKFIDSLEGVLPDMSARVSFLSQEVTVEAIKEKPKIVVPSSAVAERNGSKVVFVVNDGVVKMMPVKLGAPFGGGFELVEGPSPGTRVVTSPSPQLSDGQGIKEKGT